MNSDADNPPPLPPPVPIEITAAKHAHRRSRHRRGSSLLGRLWLVAFFCLFYAVDAYFYFNTPLEGRREFLGTAIVCNLWITALLFGIWIRQSWARSLLIILIFLRIVTIIIVIPNLLGAPAGYASLASSMMKLLGVYLLLHVAVAVILMTSRDIQRLTRRTYE